MAIFDNPFGTPSVKGKSLYKGPEYNSSTLLTPLTMLTKILGGNPYDKGLNYNIDQRTGKFISQNDDGIYNIGGTATELDLSTKDKTWLDKMYESEQAQSKEAQAYNKGKTIYDLVTGTAAYLGNKFAKRPEAIPAPLTVPEHYADIYGTEKGLIDKSLAVSLAAANKTAQESGSPELISSNLGSFLDAQSKAYATVAQDVSTIDQANRKSEAVAQTANNLATYTARTADAEAIAKSNLMRSQIEAEQLTANSKMLNNYMTNKQDIQGSLDTQTMLYNLLKNKTDLATFYAYLNAIGGNTSIKYNPYYTSDNSQADEEVTTTEKPT